MALAKHTVGALKTVISQCQEKYFLAAAFPIQGKVRQLVTKTTSAGQTGTGGKWIQVEGHSKPLIDFSSNDIFGIQNHAELLNAEKNVAGISGQSLCYYQSLLAQVRIEVKLAYLHGKATALMSTDSFQQTLDKWLRRLPSIDTVYVHEGSGLLSDDFVSQSFKDESDLRNLLKTTVSSGLKYVIMEAGSCSKKMDLLRKVCDVTEPRNVKVILLDPLGTILIRHVLGDHKKNLDTLKRPHIIQTTLDTIHGSDSVTCLLAPQRVKDWCQQFIPHECQVLGPATVARTLKALELLPIHSGKCCSSLLHSLNLKQDLEYLGLIVKWEALQLIVEVDDPHQCHLVVKTLREKGHYVCAVQNKDNTGIRVALNGHHSAEDVTKLTTDLLQTLQSIGVIQETEHFTKVIHKKNIMSFDETGNKVSNHDHNELYKDEILHQNLPSIKMNPRYLEQDLQWLKSVYFTPVFDEILQQNLSIFDYHPNTIY